MSTVEGVSGGQHDAAESLVAGSTTRRSVMKAALAGAVGGLVSGNVAAQEASPAVVTNGDQRPNILVFLVDQMRDWQAFPDQETLNQAFPNMARLQQGAVRFGRHYTCTNMCSPARGSLVTGLYSHQTGLVLTQGGNVDDLTPGGNGHDDATPEATPAAEAQPPYPVLDTRFPTWGHLLRDQGYETYWWGKWHLNESCDVEQYGFAGGTCPSPNGGPGSGMVDDPKTADQAIAWLEGQGDRGPWCTTVSFVNPHDIMWFPRRTRTLEGQNDPPSVFDHLPANFENAADLASQHKPRLQLASILAEMQVAGEVPHRGPGFERHWIEMLDLYYQLHGYLDREIGRVLDALEANPEVAANTIIVFTSDHGEYCGAHGMRGKGAGLYEEGIRVPLWVKDPTDRLSDRPETTRTQLTSSVDVTPLLLSLANDGWRDQPELGYLADRLDLTAVMADADAPGRPYALHATDEDGYEYGPRLFPFLEDAPFHVLGLITEDAKIGVYTHWADDSDEIVPVGQELEFYDYSTEEGRLELANTAGIGNQRFRELYDQLMTEAVANELRAPLPDELQAIREETMTATLARISYDRAASRD